ncbi:GNAT family N-acetyltransferase [Caballeronia sordidicola]|uniref:GNAT family N-acetyltransferase n=1 Tax=Caballeronia sordidicola TaxID=196367 RepID=UPI0005562C3B|nr:GNAT family N-acetyltransferase [Caballeronia sordidicola]
MSTSLPAAGPTVLGNGFSLLEFEDRHLTAAVELSAALEWPYRLEDWQFAFALGKAAVIEDAGSVVATAMWWPFGDVHATFGMIIVSPALQGRGFGQQLVLDLLRQTDGRTVFLNSTREGYRLYGRLGFIPDGRIHQHQGVLNEVMPPAPEVKIDVAHQDDFEAIASLDERAIGFSRRELLAALSSVGRFTVVNRSGVVRGYACSRRFGRGYVIGPVVADGAADAKALIRDAASRLTGEFVRVDVTEHSGLSTWLEIAGLIKVDQVVSMSRGQRSLHHSGERVFPLANQSLG